MIERFTFIEFNYLDFVERSFVVSEVVKWRLTTSQSSVQSLSVTNVDNSHFVAN